MIVGEFALHPLKNAFAPVISQAVAGRVGLQSVANADHETKKQNMQHEVRGSSRGATGVCHSTSGMARMKRQTESLGRAISDVQIRRYMLHADNTTSAPLLNCEVLDVDVPSANSRTVVVDHGDGGASLSS